MNTKPFLLLVLLGISQAVAAQPVTVDIEIPALKAQPYHRPFVAVWVESDKRKGVKSLAVWYDQDDWLKDLRQWWRKLGRKGQVSYDSATGATRKPGSYTLSWDGTDASGKPLPAGKYLICVEAAREEGGRDFIRQAIQLGNSQSQSFELKGKKELGLVKITVK